MKKPVALFLSLIMLLSMAACSSVPEDMSSAFPEHTYDMSQYESFWQIFEEKGTEQWQEMGRYTLALKGLGTPVTVEMDGLTVLSVSAYGHTQNVNLDPFQEEINADIDAYEGAILVNDQEDYKGNTWILTKNGCFSLHPKGDISTQVYVDDTGALRYRRYLGHYYTSFDQWDTAPIDLCYSRDDFVYETGRAEIGKNDVMLTAEETFSVSDLYDLDALFAQAKKEGLYEEYSTVDEVMADNRNQAQE